MKKPKFLKLPTIGVLVASVFLIGVIAFVIAAIPAGTMVSGGDSTVLSTNNTYTGYTGATGKEPIWVTASGPTEINTVDDIRIRIPSAYTNTEWDVTDANAKAGIPYLAPFNATGNVDITLGGLAYEESVPASGVFDIVVIDVTANFADGDRAYLYQQDLITTSPESGIESFDYSVDGGVNWSVGSGAVIYPENFDGAAKFVSNDEFLLDMYNTFNHCDNASPNGLGGTWNDVSKTCTVTSSVTVTDKPMWVTHGVTLLGGGNVNLVSTSNVNFKGESLLELVGKDGDPSNAIVVDGVNIDGGDALYYGVVITGSNVAGESPSPLPPVIPSAAEVDITFSNSTVANVTEVGVYVAPYTDNFTLDGVTTSDLGGDGVLVKHHSVNGTIINHTANGNAGDGIEIMGNTNVEVSDSELNNNGGYGLYIHDSSWTVLYQEDVHFFVEDLPDHPDEIFNITDALVDGNTMTGNATIDLTAADVGVDVLDGSAWDAAQSAAINTYVTINETNGTLPGTQAAPAAPVPEFHEYVLMLTLMIALGFMYKRIPQMGSGMRAA